MPDKGWISLHRKLLDSPIWIDSTPEQKVILITILLSVNHAPQMREFAGEIREIRPGQWVTGLDDLARKCGKGVSVRNVRTALDRFKKLEFLTSETTNRGRLLTVCNWGAYQDKDKQPDKQPDKQLTSNRQATDKQLTTNNNVIINKKDNGTKKEEKPSAEKSARGSTPQKSVVRPKKGNFIQELLKIFKEEFRNSRGHAYHGNPGKDRSGIGKLVQKIESDYREHTGRNPTTNETLDAARKMFRRFARLENKFLSSNFNPAFINSNYEKYIYEVKNGKSKFTMSELRENIARACSDIDEDGFVDLKVGEDERYN